MRRSSQPSGEDVRILAGAWRGIVEDSIGFEKVDEGFEGEERGFEGEEIGFEGEDGLKEGEEG